MYNLFLALIGSPLPVCSYKIVFLLFGYNGTAQLIKCFWIVDGGVAQVDTSRYDPVADPNLATRWKISEADPGSGNYLYVLF